MDTIIKLPRHNGATCCVCVCVCFVLSEKETDKISNNITSFCLHEVWLVLIRYAPCSSKWSFILPLLLSKTLRATPGSLWRGGGRFGTETHSHKHYPERLIRRNSTRQPWPGGIEVFWDENQKQSDNQRVWKGIKRFSSLVGRTLGIIDPQP